MIPYKSALFSTFLHPNSLKTFIAPHTPTQQSTYVLCIVLSLHLLPNTPYQSIMGTTLWSASLNVMHLIISPNLLIIIEENSQVTNGLVVLTPSLSFMHALVKSLCVAVEVVLIYQLYWLDFFTSLFSFIMHSEVMAPIRCSVQFPVK